MYHVNSEQLRPRLAIAIMFLIMATSPVAFAGLITIEPDAFAHQQALNNVSPYVTLSTGVPPSNNPTFDVVAYTDSAGASTGNKVFAHAGGIPFWNTSRTLRMNFHALVTSVSLDYIASGFFDATYSGRLEAYSAGGALLTSYNTAALAGGQHATMTVNAPQIAYAIAYPPADPFGDLDHLRFTAVPEPATVSLLAIHFIPPCVVRRRLKPR
jgi:hypothetical protein